MALPLVVVGVVVAAVVAAVDATVEPPSISGASYSTGAVVVVGAAVVVVGFGVVVVRPRGTNGCCLP